MVILDAVSSPNGGSHRSTCPAEAWVPDRAQSPDRLTPLIHELLSSDLVCRSDDGAFQLRDDIQKRLQQMSAASRSRVPQVFVGRKCENCASRGMTRLVNGARLCEACI